MAKRKKPYGYLVSSPRIPQGRFFKTMKEARKEMNRQMMAGHSSSGISEVSDKKSLVKKTTITVSCSKCGDVLFRGTEKQRKRLVLYCQKCAEKSNWKKTKDIPNYTMWESPRFTIQMWINPYEVSIHSIKNGVPQKAIAHRTFNTKRQAMTFIKNFMKKNP